MTNLFAKFKESGWRAFETYRVRIKMRDIVGGLPKDPALIDAWVGAMNKEKSAEERKAIADADKAAVAGLAEDVADKQMVVFGRIPGKGLGIEGRCVKAMLKESGNIIREIAPGGVKKEKVEGEGGKTKTVLVASEGVTALRSKVGDQVFVVEEWIPIGRMEPDAVEERPIHVMTAQGPRTSIKRCEICRDVELEFTVKRRRGPRGSGVPEDSLLAILDYAQTSGLGADRSQGRGSFEVLSVEKLDD